MKFKRINDDTIRCIITEEDMLEHGVDVEDFLRNRGNAREFLHEIVEQAAKEVGYEMHSGMLSMQVMPLPSNALSVTFSEQNENSLAGLIENIKNALGGVENVITQDKLEGIRDAASDEERGEMLESLMQDLFGSVLADEEEEEQENHYYASDSDGGHKEHSPTPFIIIRFSSMVRVEEYCKALPYEKSIKSSVYKEDGSYYLLMSRGKMGKRLFEELGFMSMEYGNLVGADAVLKSYMKEHMQCIIKKGAVKVLKNL